jgi:WD40-like Beta Propeller Repeat
VYPKFIILPPEKSSFDQIAVSPDGRHLAFTAATGGKPQLWAQALDSTEARAFAGTQGATFPFWSPDSRFIGFFADGRLKKIEVTGGPVLTLCEAPAPYGGAWSRAGVVLFGQVARGVPRQNSIHLYFQQLRSSFSQPLFFRSKFAEVWGQSRTAVATRSA